MSAVRSEYGPTKQYREQLGYALEELNTVSKHVKAIQETVIPQFQKAIGETFGL